MQDKIGVNLYCKIPAVLYSIRKIQSEVPKLCFITEIFFNWAIQENVLHNMADRTTLEILSENKYFLLEYS